MAAKQNRYPGVQPFRGSQRHLFFGREEDIENLYDFILLEKIVVLFGKSGYGKSSLLSAGVLPKFGEPDQPASFRFEPMELRFGSFVEGTSFTPLETVRRVAAPDQPATGPTLWQIFKQHQADLQGGDAQFLLVFDQFEEFFTYPSEQQREFRRQLAELLFSGIPHDVQETLDTLPEAERQHLVRPMNVKAVLSIRSDRMSLLDSMKDVLPTILHKRYELRPLAPAQARDAIVKPARLAKAPDGEAFATPPFEYVPEALDAMLVALSVNLEKSETAAGRSKGVEAFLLQILCNHVEDLVGKGKVPDLDGNGLPDVTLAQLPQMANLLDAYLDSKLVDLDPARREAAERMLEDGLLSEDTATGEARRTSVDGRSLLAQFQRQGLSQALLDEMERSYLVRREPNTVGGFSYEVSHDRLVEPLQKRKAARRVQEERRLATKRQRRLIGIVTAALVVAAVAVTFGVWAFQQRDLAEKRTIEATQATEDAKRQKDIADQKTREVTAAAEEAKRQKDIADQKTSDAEAALADMQAAQKKEMSAKIDQHIASARRMMELGDRAMANRILDEASRLAKHYPHLLKKIKENRPK